LINRLQIIQSQTSIFGYKPHNSFLYPFQLLYLPIMPPLSRAESPASSPKTTARKALRQFKGVFAGSGSAGMHDMSLCKIVISMTGKSNPSVLYLGTATYDLPGPRIKQTIRFQEAGCKVTALEVANRTPSRLELQELVDNADIILVSGGNTLFAVNRWRTISLDTCLWEALQRGTDGPVFAGGSAGAICWFNSGHSDSMDPGLYKLAMEEKAKLTATADENSEAPKTESDAKPWKYIRIEALGFLPGLCCPHYDRIQSNGVLRADDLDEMMMRHKGERAICIDHWAALVVDGAEYRVVSVPNKPGSVHPVTKEWCRDASGVPGVWIKEVVNDSGNDIIETTLVSPHGKLQDILAYPSSMVKDPLADICRMENPDLLA
jgi:dipeptidase E